MLPDVPAHLNQVSTSVKLISRQPTVLADGAAAQNQFNKSLLASDGEFVPVIMVYMQQQYNYTNSICSCFKKSFSVNTGLLKPDWSVILRPQSIHNQTLVCCLQA